MSLLSAYVTNHLIPSLENALIEETPEVQEALVSELQDVAKRLGSWLEEKIKLHIPKKD